MPFSFRICVKIQSHLVNLQLNNPSNIRPHQQEGDFDLRIALLHHLSLATSRASRAQFKYCSVMSSHVRDTILSHLLSQGILGVYSHQRSSGQTGMACQDLTMSIIFWFEHDHQSNLQFNHAKQALTRIISLFNFNVSDNIQKYKKCKNICFAKISSWKNLTSMKDNLKNIQCRIQYYLKCKSHPFNSWLHIILSYDLPSRFVLSVLKYQFFSFLQA